MVAKPSPPEICWHLIAPLSPGAPWCEEVVAGHCTRKLCSNGGSAHKARTVAANPLPRKRVLSIKPPSGTFGALGAHNHALGKIHCALWFAEQRTDRLHVSNE